MSELLFKVIIIGDRSVGKTSFVHRYVDNSFPRHYRLTIGVDFALKKVKWTDNRTIKLQLWDISGQERFTSMTRVYYKGAHACIVMFDISRRQTFRSAVKWKEDLDTKCSLQDGSPVPCLLIANKCDLSPRAVERNETEKVCRKHNFVGWTETCVKKGLMVEECMRFLIEEMVNKDTEMNDVPTSIVIHQGEPIQLNPDSPQMKITSRCSC